MKNNIKILSGLCAIGMSLFMGAQTTVTVAAEESPLAYTQTLSTGTESYRNVVNGSSNGTVSLYPIMRPTGGSVNVTLIPDEGYELTDVKAYNSKNLEIMLMQVSENVYQFVQPTSVVTVRAVFTPIVPPITIDDIQDVSESDWYYSFVKEMVDRGLLLDNSSTMFEPNKNITRGSMAVLLSELTRHEITPPVTETFTDVDEDDWYYEAAYWCTSNGILLQDNWYEFHGEDYLTREEFILALYNFAKLEGMYTHMYQTVNLAPFHDKDEISENCEVPMSWAVRMNFISGNHAGNLKPQSYVSRAEISVVLSTFLKAYEFYVRYGS